MASCWGCDTNQHRRRSLPTVSTTELTKLSHTRARALSVEEVNQIGRDTGQAERLRTGHPASPVPRDGVDAR